MLNQNKKKRIEKAIESGSLAIAIIIFPGRACCYAIDCFSLNHFLETMTFLQPLIAHRKCVEHIVAQIAVFFAPSNSLAPRRRRFRKLIFYFQHNFFARRSLRAQWGEI